MKTTVYSAIACNIVRLIIRYVVTRTCLRCVYLYNFTISNEKLCFSFSLQTAFIAYMPYYFAGSGFHLDEKTSPWRRSYNEKRKTIWERDPKYCERVSFPIDCNNSF